MQGDISACNLFIAENGEIGLFDFNRCGDNILFCDAVIAAFWMERDSILPLEQIAERIERGLVIDL